MTSKSTRTQSLLSHHPHLHLPILVSAPLRPYALSPLATAITRAHALGFLSSTPADAHELSLARQTLLPSLPLPSPPAVPHSSDPPHPSPTELISILSSLSQTALPEDPVQIGIGYQIYFSSLPAALRDIRTYLPAAAWLFAWSSMTQLGLWARAIHAATSGRTRVWVQVGTVESALEAVEACCGRGSSSQLSAGESKEGYDLPRIPPESLVLVAQGSDAGGHQLQRSASLLTLLPELFDALSSHGHGYKHIPILAAGGILDSRGAAAALALGASGVVLGTRLIGARELSVPEGFRRQVLEARDGGESTVATRLFDRLRGTGDFPEGWYGRALVNRSWRDVEGGLEEGVVKGRYERFMKRQGEGIVDEEAYGEEGTLVAYAGSGVGLVREVSGAGEIVEEVRGGVEAVLGRARDGLAKASL
ncbi:MAG: hypothetical protein MMC23_007058 [Stictis urceolatum]|nr:hypothetical protein [Stictis urceolata]